MSESKRDCDRLLRIMRPAIFLGLILLFTNGGKGSEVEFLRDVRPILAGHCFKCHGPDEESRKSKLRLDIREDALKPAKSGKHAIVPGKVEESELVRRVTTDDEDDLMPPPSAKLPLSSKDKEVLRKWIASGAEYKTHWAFVKPVQAKIPEVKDTGWPKNEIDYFVLAHLEKEGLKPSPQADKYTLVRRLYLDLIGLPPTPEQADAFVNDASPDAYEKLVNALLDSPHYGERWARRWLDLARYADTNGYEKDRPRSMWPYRDWVIGAINQDMPFDEFTIEQLAGDMLPNATTEQIVATGFHRNTMINEEGGIDPLEYRFYSLVDRVHVTATTWLGLTMACAQCHTHKYDPIQHTEYYQFMAFLNNADEPTMEIPNAKIAQERAEVEKKISELTEALAGKFPVERKIDWEVTAEVQFASIEGASGEVLLDGSIRVTGKRPEKDSYTVELTPSLARITDVQVEAIPDELVGDETSKGKGGPGRTGHGNFVLSELKCVVVSSDGRESEVKLSRAEADFSQDGFPAANAIDGKQETGWAIAKDGATRTHRRVIFTLAEPLKVDAGMRLKFTLDQKYGGHHTLGRFRVSVGNNASENGDVKLAREKHLQKRFGEWLEAEEKKAVQWKPVTPVEASSQNPILTLEDDGVVFASGDFTKSDTYHLKFSKVPAGVRAIRIEALPDHRLPNNGPGTVHYEGPEGDFWFSNLKVVADGKPVALKNPSESYASGNNNAAKAIDDDLQSGWSVAGGVGKAQSAVYQFEKLFEGGGELEMDMTFERYYAAALGKFRIYVTTDDGAKASALSNESLSVLLKRRGDLAALVNADDDPDHALLLKEFLAVAPELESERKQIAQLRQSMPKYPTTLVMKEWGAGHKRKTHLHHRGEFLQVKEEVQPGVPAFLPDLPSSAPRNRLGLAKWLVSRDNPLTARVVMNRDWEAFFGRGLVRTLEDFGFQGDLPSHPELLDWLAVEFMKRGWSQKEMRKLIVMSATYQQSSESSRELIERDPQNILLARGPRFRIEAELVRDAALVESGLLSQKIGGPSVFPPQPAGVSTEGAYGPLQWKTSEGADRYRRGLYTFAKRTTPYAMTATFDGPSGEACLARRDRSNTPLQALTLLNDDVFVECANKLGAWAGAKSGSETEIATGLFRRCLTRPPHDEEISRIVQFYHAQLDRFEKGELKPEHFAFAGESTTKPQAAWATVARVLMNLDESITKE